MVREFEWNLPQFAILKSIQKVGKLENPIFVEDIDSEVRKFLPEDKSKAQTIINGESEVAFNEGKIKIIVEGERQYFILTEEGKRFLQSMEERLKKIEKENKIFEEATKPLSTDELLQVLGTTVRHDDINKLITFFSMLCAYTEDSQFNVSYRAPSSTGKSYIPIELSQYFPEEDIRMIAYSSPTSFYHDTGEWSEENKAIIINLERKILIFLDQPHDMLLQRLRPLLSHDKKELLYKITDKSERKGLRTKNVIIKGFPSVIFCTGSLKIDEQEATRNFILSPEINAEKIREGIFLKALRKGNPLAFKKFLEQHPEREILKERIKMIKNANIKHVIIENVEDVVKKFIERYPKLKPRHQRDIERLISLIQGFAVLNFWHRKKENGNVYANEEDIKNAFELFDKVAESQELGIPPFIYNFFKEVILPLWNEKNQNSNTLIGLTRKEVLSKHYEVYGRAIPEWYLKQEILPPLESCGLIYQESDPNDKRKMLIYVCLPTPQSNSTYFENVESKGGANKYVELRGGVNTIEKEKNNWFAGKCSYCGNDTQVTLYQGHFICKDCLKEEQKPKCYKCGSTENLTQTEDYITHKPLWICKKCLKEVME